MVKMPILSNLQPFIAPKVLYEWFWLRNIKYQIEWFDICSVVSYFVSNIQNQGDSPKKKWPWMEDSKSTKLFIANWFFGLSPLFFF